MSNDLITKEAIEGMINNQAYELEVKSQEIDHKNRELELRQQEEQHGYDYAQKSLEAQKEDLKSARQHQKTMFKMLFFFLLAIVIVIAIVIMFSIHKGEKDIAMEIIKGIIYITTGGLGGYGLGKSKKDSPENNSNTD